MQHKEYGLRISACGSDVDSSCLNWKVLERLGVSAVRWFGGEMGFWVNVRQPMMMDGSTMPLDPNKPVILSNYIAFPTPGQDAKTQGLLGRQTRSEEHTLNSSHSSASSMPSSDCKKKQTRNLQTIQQLIYS